MVEFAVKRIGRIGQLICAVNVLLASSAIGITYNQHHALSKSVYPIAVDSEDLICYMRTEDELLINLNQLCGARRSNNKILSILDQRFLEDYQRFLSKRSRSSPLVQAALLQLQQSPHTVIQRAHQVCANIRSGMLQSSAPQSQESVDADLVNTMALEFYCPNLDD